MNEGLVWTFPTPSTTTNTNSTLMVTVRPTTTPVIYEGVEAELRRAECNYRLHLAIYSTILLVGVTSYIIAFTVSVWKIVSDVWGNDSS